MSGPRRAGASSLHRRSTAIPGWLKDGVFVGRQAELALIEASLAQDPPAASVFVVHGPGGIGKTSLVEQVRRIAQARGMGSLRLDVA